MLSLAKGTFTVEMRPQAEPVTAEGVSLDRMLLDERFAAQFPADQAGVPQLRFAGDVTRVWYDTLDRRWREPGHVLGGITGSDALFVLEVLARHAPDSLRKSCGLAQALRQRVNTHSCP